MEDTTNQEQYICCSVAKRMLETDDESSLIGLQEKKNYSNFPRDKENWGGEAELWGNHYPLTVVGDTVQSNLNSNCDIWQQYNKQKGRNINCWLEWKRGCEGSESRKYV